MGLPVAVVVGRPALVDHVLDQHPERRPPVADVVLREHVVADEAQQARNRVADDRAPQVADVHLLRDVRRAVVDDHAVRVGGAGNAEARVLEESRDALLQPLARRRKLMKPGPATLGGSAIAARSRFWTSSSASSRGGRPSCFASAIAALLW